MHVELKKNTNGWTDHWHGPRIQMQHGIRSTALEDQREVVQSLGGLWIVAKGGEIPDGGTGNTIMTLGYDPQNNRYVGTFIGSMMMHLWILQWLTRCSEKTLTLDRGPQLQSEFDCQVPGHH